MAVRKYPLINDQYYHIFSRSIAGYQIFNSNYDYERLLKMFSLCRHEDFHYKYSKFCELSDKLQNEVIMELELANKLYVNIIAYCIMPTHIHLLLQQIHDEGIAVFLQKVLNSYARYFNTVHKRTGPLWASRFKNVLVNNDEQLLHLTRYIHLNPSSAGLVEKPEEWAFSSHNHYINPKSENRTILSIPEKLLEVKPKAYKKFVDDQKSYQQDLAIIKGLLIDDYTG